MQLKVKTEIYLEKIKMMMFNMISTMSSNSDLNLYTNSLINMVFKDMNV